ALANLLRQRAERGDRRDDVARRLPGPEPLGLVEDDLLGPSGLAPPTGEALRHDALEVVDVVEVAAVELVDGGIEVARNRDVDQEQRPPLALPQRALDVGARQDVARRARRAEDDVDARELPGGVLERHRTRPEPIPELRRLLDRAI